MGRGDYDQGKFAELIYISSDDDYGGQSDADLDGMESDDQAESDSNNEELTFLNQLVSAPPPELCYSVLKESDIRRRIDAAIDQLSAFLCLPKSDTTLILRHFNWEASKAEEKWFADEFEVRRQVGLPTEAEKVTIPRSNERILTCTICFERHRLTSFNSAACGHRFCRWCWGKYIAEGVNDGPRSLKLKCPEPSCKIVAGDDLIRGIADEKVSEKYSNFALRSYVENSKRRKWCPAPNCEHAVEFASSGDLLNYDVSCLCSHSFCWNCSEEKHSPVNCETVSNWMLKNSSESQNEVWKKVNTKPCPKCSRAIEKNRGCMHMTCAAPCGYQFCWVCLGQWAGHSSCNRYTEDVRVKAMESERQELIRYQHYYNRWAENEKSRQIAVKDLKDVRENVVSKIETIHRQDPIQLGCLTEAWEQIVECRRVLKWTYAYGYYLPSGEAAKKQFFEYLQGQADTCLDKLHHCAEKEMRKFVVEGSCSEEYSYFRMKLIELTKLCKTYFENLVQALENGLSDVETGINSKRQENGLSDFETGINSKRQKTKK